MWDFAGSSLPRSSWLSSASSSVDGVFDEVETSKRNFQDTASQVLALGAALRPFVLEACGGELSSALREFIA